MWEKNAKYVAETFGAYVDWEERFYECPECGEPIYECDWNDTELMEICPVCGFNEECKEREDDFIEE